MKTIYWVDSSKEEIRSFPEEVRRKAGHELNRVQRGMEPVDWKPMPSIGTGVSEIRIHDGSGYRIIYIAKYAEAIYVLHAFLKQSATTAKRDIGIAKTRLKAIIQSRR
ncbi:MAG: hypothetical protein A2W76_04750 [Gammaproteobacteria bacterium RIFCSPLOWO2_12_47_11]|nr:MAG: hypothetical protein A2W76_04750 [Gammaproteobacteria bacterium RIFCSPLOWO2_12_47_11]